MANLWIDIEKWKGKNNWYYRDEVSLKINLKLLGEIEGWSI